jgi:hypothetical protein
VFAEATVLTWSVRPEKPTRIPFEPPAATSAPFPGHLRRLSHVHVAQ